MNVHCNKDSPSGRHEFAATPERAFAFHCPFCGVDMMLGAAIGYINAAMMLTADEAIDMASDSLRLPSYEKRAAMYATRWRGEAD